MSIPAIAWCTEQRGLPPGEWVVLFHLCHCHNHETGRCDPSQEYLAAMTGMGARTVRRHLNSLEAAGLILRKRRGIEGGGRISDFYILGHEPAKLATNVTGQSVRTNRPNGAEKVHEMAGKQEETGKEQEDTPPTPQGGRGVVSSEPSSQLDLLSETVPTNPKVRSPKTAGGLREGCASLDDEFELVWQHYPRKVGKGNARKAWEKARKQKTFQEISQPLGVFIRVQRGTEMRSVPHLATWLNQERWGDDQTHARNRAETTSDRLDRLGAAPAGASGDEIAGPTRTPPEIELRID